ncbi:RdgB/HAM1 family non-canonical purine NTP pyrophosphatase [Sphingomonas sp. SUN039]|uniref:RdgB/HAM1 family non-canonical purine NTP pyrophosphatase n=1 Tax=Sphingomonas sp. SUN039 TaxID=2937787 RepID=UPI0021646DB4|nr:RdgB/HAM1 family non-canonical purine NTP pyrophosphatase [Sphingomonas sp. SUN039]UVO54040.1 RdgB/HAM1 family non-canonical purine NTP pyrophosphatase [Sphingomonas sp. SUN039]
MKKLTPGRLVIASHNEGKVREIRALLAPFGMEPVSAKSLDLPEPEETGTTFVANAMLKAQSAADLSGLPALADDSGLVVEALNGEPGVYTANWAETAAADGTITRDWMLAMQKVEDRLQALGPDVSRSAHFTCTLALVWPDGSDLFCEGRVEGTLVWPPRGDKGFGYDPVFVPLGHTETFGEMDPDAKHAISHRADAFAKLVAAAF